MQTTEVEVTGTATVELTPGGAEIGWGGNQVWVKYDGEVSAAGINDEGFVESRPEAECLAKGHSGDLLDAAIGVYEAHCEIVRRNRNGLDEE